MRVASLRFARAGLAFWLFVAGSAAAVAEPAARLMTVGSCPSESQMRAALIDVIDVVDDEVIVAEWTVAVASRRAGAWLTLRHRDGVVVLTRQLTSRDCRALASAFAVIIHAFLRELAGDRSLPGTSASAPSSIAPAEPKGQQEPGSGTVGSSPGVGGERSSERAPGESILAHAAERKTAREHAASRLVGRTRARRAAGVVSETSGARNTTSLPGRPGAGPGDPGVRLSSDTAAATSRWIELAASAGGWLAHRTGVTRFGLLEAGWRLGPRLSARMQLTGSLPSVLDQDTERLKLRLTTFEVGLGHRTGTGRVWVRPALLAGAGLWQVDPLGLGNGPIRTRVRPVAKLLVQGGLRIGEVTSLRAEIGLRVFLGNDRYNVLPTGEVSQTPRAALAVSLGIEWASFP